MAIGDSLVLGRLDPATISIGPLLPFLWVEVTSLVDFGIVIILSFALLVIAPCLVLVTVSCTTLIIDLLAVSPRSILVVILIAAPSTALIVVLLSVPPCSVLIVVLITVPCTTLIVVLLIVPPCRVLVIALVTAPCTALIVVLLIVPPFIVLVIISITVQCVVLIVSIGMLILIILHLAAPRLSLLIIVSRIPTLRSIASRTVLRFVVPSIAAKLGTVVAAIATVVLRVCLVASV